MKMSHVCNYNNSDATFRLLMSGDINPDPESESEAELQQFEIIFAEIITLTGKKNYSVFAMGHPMKTQVGWMYSIIALFTVNSAI